MIGNRRIESWRVTTLLAITLGLAIFSVADPLHIGATWVGRALLMGACLAAGGLAYCVEIGGRKRAEKEARLFLERLSRTDLRRLSSDERVENSLPRANPAWRSAVLGLQRWLLEFGERLEESEQARASAEVRLSRAKREHRQIREIFDGLSEPIVVTNSYDELMLANAAASRLFTLPDIDRRQSLEDAVDCKGLAEVISETRRRKAPATRTGEVEISNGDQSRCFRVSCRSLSLGESDDAGGQGVVSVFSDKSAEKEIQKRHAEFVAAASHEMKTPLAGIRAYVELLRDGDAEDEATREEFLEVIDTQSDRLQRLIENLLNLARIEAGVVNVDKQDHSLNELLERAFAVVQPPAEQKGIVLNKELSPLHLATMVDHDMVTQSAINLLSNAIKYTEPGGIVTLRSRLEDNAVVFEVEDTGVGLSEEDGRKVFDRFYRVKKDRQMASGTGLGLPLAKHIVEDVHGGSLTVSSQLGRGSVFRVSLPGMGRANR